MLSDSTGYGGSSGTSSLYSSCIVVPASSTVSTLKYPYPPRLERAPVQDKVDKNQKKYCPIEYNIDNYYMENGYFKFPTKYNQDYVDKFSDFNSDSEESLDEIQPSVQFRKRIVNLMSMDTNQSQFYGADFPDGVEYDRCPTEMESCFQSQFSSRRNTAPFSSPVPFLEEKDDGIPPSELYSSSAADSSIIAILSNAEKSNLPLENPDRPVCLPWKSELSNTFNDSSVGSRRSLLQDACEYHKGNSVRLKVMPMPLRASIVNTHFEHPQTGVLIKPNTFIQNIIIGTPSQSLGRNNRFKNMSPITEADTVVESGGDSTSTPEDSGIDKTQSEDYFCTSSGTESKSYQKEIKAPAKPPRGRLVTKSTSEIIKPSIETVKIRKSATLKCEKSSTKVIFQTKTEKKNKQTGIRLGSCETIHFDKNEPTIQRSNKDKDPYRSSTSTASSFVLTMMPKKSILKHSSTKEPRQLDDPNAALFGPIEHVYECIDSDPSSYNSSDDDHSVTGITARPVSFTFSETTTTTNTQKSRRSMPDLRPALPARPFCWPFVLFPPDMTFHPRSLHAYHRREAFERGELPIRNVNFQDSYESEDKNSDLITTEENEQSSSRSKISRIPSILSKVI